MLLLIKKCLKLTPGDHDDYRTYVVVLITSLFALITHALLIPIFFAIGAQNLALINAASVLIWIAIFLLNARGRYVAAIDLGSAEIALHSLAATAILGSSFGFHFYLWPLTTLVVLNPALRSSLSYLVAGSIMLLFALLSVFAAGDLLNTLEPTTVHAIRFANIMLAGAPMILSGTFAKQLFRRQKNSLIDIAQTDELTGAYNRRYALNVLKQADSTRRETGQPYAIGICDLDHFKSINDNFGHDVGDSVLRQFSSLMTTSVRSGDCMARWGGEEFILIFPGATGSTMEKTLNKIQGQLRSDKRIRISDDRCLSMSAGVAEAGDDDSMEAVIKRADEALYLAKTKGRDAVVFNQRSSAESHS